MYNFFLIVTIISCILFLAFWFSKKNALYNEIFIDNINFVSNQKEKPLYVFKLRGGVPLNQYDPFSIMIIKDWYSTFYIYKDKIFIKHVKRGLLVNNFKNVTLLFGDIHSTLEIKTESQILRFLLGKKEYTVFKKFLGEHNV